MSRLAALTVAGLLFALAGCGGGGQTVDDMAGASAASSAPGVDAHRDEPGRVEDPENASPNRNTTSGGTKPGITIATRESRYGTILFDGDDQAIYLFGRESSERSECYGNCAVAWPPVLTRGEPKGAGAVSSRLLGTIARKDGTTQVTYNGHPLYYYESDPRGQVLCQNVVEFGGRWLVVDARGNAVE